MPEKAPTVQAPSPWDVAAGAFIVQEAGGKVCDFTGNDNYIFGKEIIATNADVYDEFLGVVKECYESADSVQ